MPFFSTHIQNRFVGHFVNKFKRYLYITYADFHNQFMVGKTLAIACSKLDSGKESYIEKLTAMIDNSHINTLTVVIMEVPCCGGLFALARTAVEKAVRKIPIKQIVIGIKGDVLQEKKI